MDLSTRYMGIALKHPIVVSPSRLSYTLDGIRQLEDGGAAAVVLFSLFEEQVRHQQEQMDHFTGASANSFAESLSYFPEVGDLANEGVDAYFELLRRAVESVDIPIIASLNGTTNEGWIDYARQMEEAGAAGIELSIYAIESDPDLPGSSIEQRYLDIIGAVKASVSIPVALKLSPFFSSMGSMAAQLDGAGADALVLFNRFFQPDFDLQTLEVSPFSGVSSTDEIRLPLLWIALLYGQIEASLGAARGVHGPDEVIKYLLAGADCVMTASGIIENGPGYLNTLVDGLSEWMGSRGFESVEQMKGTMSRSQVADPSVFDRVTYLRALNSYGGLVNA